MPSTLRYGYFFLFYFFHGEVWRLGRRQILEGNGGLELGGMQAKIEKGNWKWKAGERQRGREKRRQREEGKRKRKEDEKGEGRKKGGRRGERREEEKNRRGGKGRIFRGMQTCSNTL